MISLVLVIAVGIFNEFWLFPKFDIEGKFLKLGVTASLIGVVLSIGVKLFGIPIVSLRYGVSAEITSDPNKAFFAAIFLIIIGLLIVLASVWWSRINA